VSLRVRSGLWLAVALLGTPALAADVLPISGAYGNAQGCDLYSHGKMPTGQGDFFLLTPNQFASYLVRCAFRSAADSGSYGIVVNAACTAANGDSDIETLRIIRHGDVGYGLLPQGGAEAGPWPACPPKDPGVPGEVSIN
jgi:hypothetical protein